MKNKKQPLPRYNNWAHDNIANYEQIRNNQLSNVKVYRRPSSSYAATKNTLTGVASSRPPALGSISTSQSLQVAIGVGQPLQPSQDSIAFKQKENGKSLQAQLNSLQQKELNLEKAKTDLWLNAEF